jgi:folate-binding protein YgfZ
MQENASDIPSEVLYTALPRAVVAVAGEDRVSFLQGLISQDVERVSPACAAYGALLTPQGKFLHDFILAGRPDAILLDCERERADDLVSRLSRFRLRARVELEVAANLTVLAVTGAGASGKFGLEAQEGNAEQLDDTVACVDPRTARLGVRLIGPADAVSAIVTERGIPEGSFEAYDALRIACEVPDGSRDMEIEKSTLLESNIDLLHGIDWEKGCYMGQELTARTKYRGLVKRRLAAYQATSDSQLPGVLVQADGRSVGEIRSRAGDRLLVSARLEAEETSGAALQAADSPILPIIAA